MIKIICFPRSSLPLERDVEITRPNGRTSCDFAGTTLPLRTIMSTILFISGSGGRWPIHCLVSLPVAGSIYYLSKPSSVIRLRRAYSFVFTNGIVGEARHGKPEAIANGNAAIAN